MSLSLREQLESLVHQRVQELDLFRVDAGGALDEQRGLREVEVGLAVHEVDFDFLQVIDVVFELRRDVDVPVARQVPARRSVSSQAAVTAVSVEIST